MKTDSIVLAKHKKTKKQHIMRRERAEIDLELCLTFSLVVLTCASSLGLSSPLQVRAPQHFLHRNVPQPTELSFCFLSCLWRFQLSSLHPIKTRCRSATDLFLLSNRASQIILLVMVLGDALSVIY